MIKVKLLAQTNKDPTSLASHAARVCYTMDSTLLDKPINVKDRLFSSGHHTTLQHTNFTFFIENVPVSAMVFGWHLTAPFYNSDQRSGRFSKMYNNPDFNEIEKLLSSLYPKTEVQTVMPWIKKGCDLYAVNIEKMTELSVQAIKKERPFASEKYIEQNAPKLAQEQLRMFLSQCMSTALDTTINLATLAALWRSAWSPEMRALTDAMVATVIKVHPDLEYMFDPEMRLNENWTPTLESETATVLGKPVVKLLQCNVDAENLNTNAGKDSVDILYFHPRSMANNSLAVHTCVEMSCATFGQDQRHRSIKRTAPKFTGAFYVSPLMEEAGLTQVARKYMQEWLDLRSKISAELWTAISPYGAVVTYEKIADLNALIHEQGKRSCWCAQEEIYHLAIALRKVLHEKGVSDKLLNVLAPPCFVCGMCREGVRFCGRDIKGTSKHKYFPDRKI